ncbi:MAG: N-acetyltransferase family protein [Lachnospiraceae bacterium]|nr:N-acetyltransferase family protein [Lachnospiraceae bacterium]
MIIRTAKKEDAKRLLAIYGPYIETTAISFEYDVPTLEEFENRITGTIPNYPYLVAEDETGIIGYIYAHQFHERKAFSHGAELSMYIDMAKRKNGVGKALLAEMENILIRQNVYVMYSCIASTDRKNDEHLTDASIKFHEKMGFTVTCKHPVCGYKFGKWYDIVWMEKRINNQIREPKDFIPFSRL